MNFHTRHYRQLLPVVITEMSDHGNTTKIKWDGARDTSSQTGRQQVLNSLSRFSYKTICGCAQKVQLCLFAADNLGNKFTVHLCLFFKTSFSLITKFYSYNIWDRLTAHVSVS